MKKQISFLTISILAITFFSPYLLMGGITVDPDSFEIITKEGSVETATLTIGNDSPNNLNYLIRTRGVHNSESILEQMDGAEFIESSMPLNYDFTVAENVPYKAGELLVRFGNKRTHRRIGSLQKMQTLTALGGASIKRDFQLVPGLSVVKLPAGMTVESALIQFNQSEDILYAQPNYEVQALSTFPDDARFNELWGMHNTGQSGGTTDADIDAPEAWDITTGTAEIIVAVIDTGVDYTHPDLSANMWVNQAELNGTAGIDDDGNGFIDDIYGYDFVNNDGDPRDDHYHGTHCAGTIGGVGNNGQGVAGVCWNVKIMAIKFLNSGGNGYTDDAIESVQYSILMGANLSSNSWGGGGYSQGLKDAIDAAGAAGMLFVAAAGNNGGDNDTYPHYPSSYTSESLISVMATDRYDNKSSFSNYGRISVDIGAPGSDIFSCQPGNRYQYLSGTSMATPHVAGACALLWSIDPSLTNIELKNLLLQTADKTLTGKCVSEGRLNLYSAILETKSPWITVEPDEGNIQPGGLEELLLVFDATNLTPGTYQAEILVLSNDPLSPAIVPVSMTVNPDDLHVSPAEGFESTGTEGGPFTLVNKIYTLTNIGAGTIGWEVTEIADWLKAEPVSGVLGPMETIDVNVSIENAELLEPNVYDAVLTFKNLDSDAVKQRSAALTVKPPDYFTELFSATNDLKNKIFTFTPDGTKAYYEACREKITEFPTDPTGGMFIPLGDDDFVEVVLNDNKEVLFYGVSYDRFYISSNGYITFDSGDTDFSGTLESHFELPRVSGLFTDLSPSNSQNVSYKQFEDKIAITFKDIPVFGDKTKLSNFQIEIFFADGTICISYLNINAGNFVAGLSRGRGLPQAFYLGSDLSEYPICWPYGDLSRNYSVNFEDFAMFASHWLEEECDIPYWCGKSDLDFSGSTDFSDLGFFTDNWLINKNWWLEPISHWKFDEGSGAIAYDSGEGSHDGAIYGAQWAEGQTGGALDFDAAGDYVNYGDIDEFEFGNNDFSVSFWFKTEGVHDAGGDLTGSGIIVGKYSFNYGRQWLFQQTPDGKMGFATYYTHNDGEGISSTNSYTGQWVHCIGVRQGAKKYLYFNGIVDVNGPCQGVLTGRSSKVLVGAIHSTDTHYYQFFNGKIDDVRIYNRALSSAEVQQIYDETRTRKATVPVPTDGAINVSLAQDLGWLAGYGAVSHDVYFGTVTPPPFIINQTGSTFDTGIMETEITYYWRIDEIGSSGTITGDVWNFTTCPPLAQPANNPIPDDESENISLNQDISWNAGSGAESHDVYFGTVNPPPFKGNQTQTTYDTGTMLPGTIYYWRIDEKNISGTTTGTIWSFTTICQSPGFAINLQPTSGAINLDPNNTVLSWTAGVFATSHDVYFGTSFSGVNNANPSSPEFRGNYTSASFDPCDLYVNLTYFWRIDEKNNCDTIKGSVWNFKTWENIIIPPSKSWWKFDEVSGSIAYDSGSGGHNGIVYGAQWAEGQTGGALDFDAINDYVDFGDIDEFEFGNNDFAIAFWLKTEGTHDIGGDQSGYGMIFSKYNFTIGRQWTFQQIPDGRVAFATYYTHTSGEGITSTNSYVGQWVHCVGVRQGSNKYLYFNGVVDVNGPCQGVLTGRTTKVVAGAIYNYEQSKYYQLFNGKIDDIRIYDRALSSTEVLNLYNAALDN